MTSPGRVPPTLQLDICSQMVVQMLIEKLRNKGLLTNQECFDLYTEAADTLDMSTADKNNVKFLQRVASHFADELAQ